MDTGIRPLDRAMEISARAFTVRCHPGDNIAIHRAIYEAPSGYVLVVDSTGFPAGHFGEIMATACNVRGLAGLVIDGAVRDSEDIISIGFPVFSRGLNASGTAKDSLGILGESVICGRCIVHTGDYIVADADGVVVIPQEDAEAVLDRAMAKAEREKVILERLMSGETTIGIYDFACLKGDV